MHAGMVMLVALAGLGGDNGCGDASEGGSVYSAVVSPYTNPYPSFATPSSYSGYYARPASYESPDYANHQAAISSTFWSYLLGHDRDVATVAEIEASVYGDGGGHWSH